MHKLPVSNPFFIFYFYDMGIKIFDPTGLFSRLVPDKPTQTHIEQIYGGFLTQGIGRKHMPLPLHP